MAAPWWRQPRHLSKYLVFDRTSVRFISNFKGRKNMTKNKKEDQKENIFIPLPRYTRLKPHQFNKDVDWSSVYQVARPFDPYVIPLSIRMGRPEKGEVSPPAQGNIELLKIPNFFHLTPPAIEKHCQALKKLCTPWPSNLPSLPLRITTINCISPSPDISHKDSRIVKLKLHIKDLDLSPRSKNKMIALVGRCYNKKTGEITLTGDRCPTRKQNKEHVIYLLKVLYFESTKYEAWEEKVLTKEALTEEEVLTEEKAPTEEETPTEEKVPTEETFTEDEE